MHSTRYMWNACRNFGTYFCIFFLFFLLKLLWIIVIGLFSSNSGCSASFIDFFNCFTNSFGASCFEKCIATFACFRCDRNPWFAFWAIFHNCPTFHHRCLWFVLIIFVAIYVSSMLEKLSIINWHFYLMVLQVVFIKDFHYCFDVSFWHDNFWLRRTAPQRCSGQYFN